MTTILVYVSPDGTYAGFESSGHAGGRMKHGHDLVCCAVSALTQTGVNALCEITEREPEVVVRDGYLRCILPEDLDEKQTADAQIILRTILRGLHDIKSAYPKNLRILTQEWRQADAYDESSALRS